MLIEELAAMVHENAVKHGWWDEDRPITETVALIHSEWSEALEEARAGRPLVYHLCADCDDGPCIVEPDTATACGFDAASHKPEGIAVELIDGVIRILDLFGNLEVNCADPHTGEASAFESLWSYDLSEYEVPASVSELVCVLHAGTSDIFDDENDGSALPLLAVMSVALLWIHSQGLDPLELLLMKHEYNKGRPYKHGKKF
jgi:hypothetical protein